MSRESILDSLRGRARVSGYTHDFYRYPARFPPEFARAAIGELTNPGDVVLDPFMGGGTTLVEARLLGRSSVGTDISSLAHFIALAKTTPISDLALDDLIEWFELSVPRLTLNRYLSQRWQLPPHYRRNVDSYSTWRIRKLLELLHRQISNELEGDVQRFATLIMLSVGQWALDGRRVVPSAGEFRARLLDKARSMSEKMKSYSNFVERDWSMRSGHCDSICLNIAAQELDFRDERLSGFRPPKLVLTSPPYPGIHVLYHRWQVEGRRETPAPFWLSGCTDGFGASHYTFGDRKAKNLDGYFTGLKVVFRNLRAIVNEHAMVVQLLAFSDVESQLPRYLTMMRDAGFSESTNLSHIDGSVAERQWRTVPNRRWHANLSSPNRSEVLIVHTCS